MFSGCLAYRGSDLTANYSGGGAPGFANEAYDVGGWHDNVTNPERLTVPAGVSHVVVSAGVRITNLNANAERQLEIRKNGVSISPAVIEHDTTNNTDIYMQVETPPIAVVAGDYFSVFLVMGGDNSVDLMTGSWLAACKAPANPNTFSGACVGKSVDQSAANYSAGAVVAWDAEKYDVGGWHDTATNNSRVTVPAGVSYVRLSAFVSVQAFTAGQWIKAEIRKNGAAMTQFMARSESHGTATILRFPVFTPPLPVTPGDYFELHLQTQTDASITVTATRSWLAIWKVD